MNILITGGTGFIGSRLGLTLLKQGHNVQILSLVNNEAEEQNKEELEKEGAKFFIGSVTEEKDLDGALKNVEIVYHLSAAQHEAGVPDQYFRDVNVVGTKNILEASIRAGVKRFVHGSTIGVYGSALDGTIDESSPLKPDNIYGVTKLEGEQLVLSYKEKISVCVIRISETFGPGDRRLLKLFKAIKKNKFFVIGNGENIHHLIYIEDLIEGMQKAATSDAAGKGGLFVLAGKEKVTTRQMADIIAERMETAIPKIHAPFSLFICLAMLIEGVCKPFGIQPPLHRRRMDFFKKSFFFSLEKSKELLDFTPETSFRRGVDETAAWYLKKNLL